MGSVYAYLPRENDFSTHGLGRLAPLEASVSETAGGMFALTVTHPMDEAGRWRWLKEDYILKASVPTRESPYYEGAEPRPASETVTREVYFVDTHCVHLRAGAGTGAKILGYCPRGTEVVKLGASGNWMRVSLAEGGRTGWIYARYLTFSRAVEEVLGPSGVEESPVLSRRQAAEQLFRVYEVEQDTEEGCVTARAMHITYDLRGNLVNGEYAPEKAAPAEVLAQISARALFPTDFSLSAAGLAGRVTADYGFRNIIECLLDPEEGVAAQAEALVVRDNFDIFLLPQAPRDCGVTIRRRKNLRGVRVTHSAADVVTRILPVGQDAGGGALYLSDDPAQRCVDSPRASDRPCPLAARRSYDVRLTGRAAEADGESVFPDSAAGIAAARARLRALAEADFQAGADEAGYGLEVDFILLQDAEEGAGYAALQSVYLHDTVRVIDEPAGLDLRARVTGYTWDALAGQYTSVRLGQTEADRRRVYSYNLPAGGIPGSKIAPGSADGRILKPMTVPYGSLSEDARERLGQMYGKRIPARDDLDGYVTGGYYYADGADAPGIGHAPTDKAFSLLVFRTDEKEAGWARTAQIAQELASPYRAYIRAGANGWKGWRRIAEGSEIEALEDLFPVSVANGGTGGTTKATARAGLGLGDVAVNMHQLSSAAGSNTLRIKSNGNVTPNGFAVILKRSYTVYAMLLVDLWTQEIGIIGRLPSGIRLNKASGNTGTLTIQNGTGAAVVAIALNADLTPLDTTETLAENVTRNNYAEALTANTGPVTSESPAATSIANDTVTNLASVSLAAGSYILEGVASFGTNASGYRQLGFGNNATQAYRDRFAIVRASPTAGVATAVALTMPVEVSAATTFYLNAYQNSGGSLTVTGGIRCVRIR